MAAAAFDGGHAEDASLAKLAPSSTHGGRQVLAACDLKAGTVVLRSIPVAVALHDELRTRRCATCLRKSSTDTGLQRCTQCRSLHYCSKRCQLKDWKSGHKAECRHLVEMGEGKAAEDGILLARCLRLLKLHSKADESKPIPACVLRSNTEQPLPPPATPYEHSWPDVAAMCTVEERSRLAQQDALKAQAAFVVHILRTGIASQRSAPIMGDLLQKFPANNFSVTDDLVVSQAAGIYPLGALLNHSCAPNCVITYEEGTHIQEIRTNCDVPAGTELTHSFVDVALPTLQRQAHLLSLYGFECRCARCAYSPALPAASAVQLPSCAVPTNIRATELALIATQTHQASHAPQGGSMAVIATSKPPEEEKALQAVDAALHQAAAAQSEQVELGILAAALHKACQVLHPLHAKLGQLHAAMQQVAMVTGDMAAAAQHAAFLAAQMRFTLSSHVGEPPSPGQMQQGDEPRPEKDAFISAVEGVITEQVRPFPPHQLMALQLGTVLELLHAAQPTEDAVQWSFEVPPGGEWLRTCLPDSVRGIFEANASVMQIVHGWQMLRRPDM